MKSFKGKLPSVKYKVTFNTDAERTELINKLKTHGCKPDTTWEPSQVGIKDQSDMITVYCGGCYDYNEGNAGNDWPCKHVSVSEFIGIVDAAITS